MPAVFEEGRKLKENKSRLGSLWQLASSMRDIDSGRITTIIPDTMVYLM